MGDYSFPSPICLDIIIISNRRRKMLFLILSTVHFLSSIDAWVSSTGTHLVGGVSSSRDSRWYDFIDQRSPQTDRRRPFQRGNTISIVPSDRSRHCLFSSITPQSSSSSSSSNSSSPPRTTTEKHRNHDNVKITRRNTLSYHRNHRQQQQQGHNGNNNKRHNNIREMFQTAKTLEKQGRWGEALTTLERILEQDPHDAHSHLALARLEARREQKSSVTQQQQQQYNGSDHDAATTTTTTTSIPDIGTTGPTTIVMTMAERAFDRGTAACPKSVHLWQAWAIYEQNRGRMDRAKQLFHKALSLEPNNPYVCHAYSLMEKKLGNDEHALALLVGALEGDNAIVTAALVCSLGESLIASQKLQEARDVYARYLPMLRTEKDRVEVYLASAWLEERHFKDLIKAQKLLQQALAINPTSGLASVALARLEGRMHGHASSTVTAAAAAAANRRRGDDSESDSSGAPMKHRQVQRRRNSDSEATMATTERLTAICNQLYKDGTDRRRSHHSSTSPGRGENKNSNYDPTTMTDDDGRVFNALATLELKQNRFGVARDVLSKGMELYPTDHNLFTAAGKVEERVGNYTGARDLYSESLRIQPSSPTLVAFALLQLRHPMQLSTSTTTGTVVDGGTQTTLNSPVNRANFTLIKGLFEEALLLDPRNGPAYNAYGNAVAQRGDLDEARSIFERGVRAGCSDAASIYHGYGMLELSCGNVERARSILMDGLESVRQNQDNILSDIPRRDRAKFLSHTLGMLELNSNRPSTALEIFEEGIARCGNSSQLLLGAALCEVRMGKEGAARTLFERSLLADQKHAQAWQAWGVMETRAGRFKRASAIFQRGIKHVPKHGSLWHGYASLEMKRGNIMNARTLFAAGLKKAPRGQYALLQGWAILELGEGNLQAARKLISEALTKNKNNGRGWIIAAEIEQADGKDGLVGLLLRRGIECAPDDAELYRRLGEYLVERGQIDDARQVYEKGMELNPMYAPLYHSMAELEARICNLEALSRLNKRAAELFNRNALEPAPLSYQAFGTKIRATRQRSRDGPSSFAKSSSTGVSALANRIGVDADHNDEEYGSGDRPDDLLDVVGEEVDFMATLDNLKSGSIMEEGLVGDLMSVESMATKRRSDL